MSDRVMFIPWVEAAPTSSERTPQLLSRLSQWYNVTAIRPGRFSGMVYDMSKPRAARYLVFILDMVETFIRTLRTARRENVSLIFAEGTYFSLAGAMVAKLRRIPMVWDNHANIRDFSAALGKSRLFFRANLLMERMLHSLSSAVLVVSGKEREAYRELGFDTGKFIVVPTCVDLDALDQGMMSRSESREKLGIQGRSVLFFGQLKYEPNLESALYISREMTPVLRERAPDAQVYMAGSGELGEEPSDGTHMLGFVPELTPWLSAADVCVAPTWRGVGILTKVIDMLSAGRATVVSPLALDGMPELEDGENCLVGHDREEFTRQVARLLDDEELRDRLGRNGRRLVEERYCWSVVGLRLRGVLDDLMKEAGNG